MVVGGRRTRPVVRVRVLVRDLVVVLVLVAIIEKGIQRDGDIH